MGLVPGAANPAAQPAPYLPPNWVRAGDEDQGAGRLIEHEFTGILTHSFTGLALSTAQAAYPVLVMQPGMGPMAPDYTVLAENLASHGYVVVGINQTYTSNLVVFPDGRVALRRPAEPSPTVTARPPPADGDRIMGVWKQDARFVLDQLDQLNADPELAFLSAPGPGPHRPVRALFWGGDRLCRLPSRMGAARPGPTWTAIRLPMKCRLAYTSLSCSSATLSRKAARRRLLAAPMLDMARLVNPGPAYFLQVSGTQHFNFTDLPLRQVGLVRPLFRLAGYAGSIDPAPSGCGFSNAYLLAFFDRYLKGSANGLLDGPSDSYPEVQFIR